MNEIITFLIRWLNSLCHYKERFTPLQEFEKEELKDYESVERAFRGMFRGFDGIEAMVRTCRYPRVLVHPILVYRQTSPNKALQRTSR